MEWVQTITVIITVIGAVVWFQNSLRGEMNSLRGEMNSLRLEMNSRFEAMEKRLDDLRSEMNSRFEAVNARFAEQGKRIELIEKILAKAVRLDVEELKKSS